MRRSQQDWMEALEGEDANFVKQFLLASGSLKALAEYYGVSYPTLRLRLDRLIEKIRILENMKIVSPFERALRLEYAEQKIDLATFKKLLAAHQQEMENRDDTPDRDR